MGFRQFSAIALMAMTSPAIAGDAACLAAVRDHGSFKAVLSDDPNNQPQYDAVKRDGEIVEATRFVAGDKRLIRRTLYGLFTQEIKYVLHGDTIRVGMSHSLDVKTLVPLKPNTSAAFRTVMTRADRFAPQFSEVKMTIGAQHETMLGECRLQTIDLVLETRTQGSPIVTRNEAVFAPDLAYPMQTTTQIVNRADVKSFITKLRAIEPWQDEKAQPGTP